MHISLCDHINTCQHQALEGIYIAHACINNAYFEVFVWSIPWNWGNRNKIFVEHARFAFARLKHQWQSENWYVRSYSDSRLENVQFLVLLFVSGKFPNEIVQLLVRYLLLGREVVWPLRWPDDLLTLAGSDCISHVKIRCAVKCMMTKYPDTGKVKCGSSITVSFLASSTCLTLSCPGTGRAIVKIGHSSLRLGSGVYKWQKRAKMFTSGRKYETLYIRVFRYADLKKSKESTCQMSDSCSKWGSKWRILNFHLFFDVEFHFFTITLKM